MKPLHERIIIGKTSVAITDHTYYRPTFLKGKDGSAALFIYRDIKYRTASGIVREKTVKDVMSYDTEDEMVEAIDAAEWLEGEDE